MSEEKPEETQPQPQTSSVDQVLAQLLKSTEENTKAINVLAKAIVEVNKKVEDAGKGNPQGGSNDPLTALLNIMKPQEGSLESFVKQAEAFSRVADALDRFRHPSKIGVAEALLMRQGLRAGFPRYMTKEELKRYDKVLGVYEALEGEEETEHVTE